MDTEDRSSTEQLQDALALEENRFCESISKGQAEVREKNQALVRDCAAKGALNSSRQYVAEMQNWGDMVLKVVERAIARRRELGGRVPELLAPLQLTALNRKLHEHVAHARAAFETHRYSGQTPPAAAVRALADESDRIVAKITSELQALGLEANLGMYTKERAMPMLNISNSTIASLNLGTVFGEHNASVQTLTARGSAELAGAIQELAEAVTTSRELSDAQRREVLEHLAFTSSEAALPAEKRKMGPLRTSINFLQTTLNNIAQLAGCWVSVEKILAAVGLVPHS